MSLRLRVLLIILVVNLAVCGVLALVLFNENRSMQEQLGEGVEREKQIRAVMGQLAAVINAELKGSSDPEAFRRQVPEILKWTGWQQNFHDVIIADVDRSPLSGELVIPAKICFNPMGSLHRAPDFNWEQVQKGLRSALEVGGTINVGAGRCEPIQAGKVNRLLGAIYYVPKIPPLEPHGLTTPMVVLGSFTVLLLLVLFLALSYSIVGPLETLSAGVRRMASGEDKTPIVIKGGTPEVDSLTRVFNETMTRIHDFNRELQEEVARATGDVRKKERQLVLSSRLAAMGTLAAGIAHEINNPLGGLMNAIRRIKDHIPPEAEMDDYFEIVEEGLDRIASTVRRVLEFSPRDIEPSAFPLIEPARRAAQFVEYKALRLGIALTVEGDDGLQINGDPREIQQVFLNLLMNSMDALEERIKKEGAAFGPRLEIRIEAREGEKGPLVTGLVLDNGPGLQKEKAERIFDLFYTTKEAGKGTGMGLAICFAIIRNHQGQIGVKASAAEGLAVEIQLPAVDSAKPEVS